MRSTKPTPASKTRSPREDVRRSHAALQIVRPLQREVGAWQAEIARLITHAERLQARREQDSAAEQRIAMLEHAIRDARARLTTELGSVPEDVRDHGRVLDVRRAMDSALAGLDEAHRLLT